MPFAGGISICSGGGCRIASRADLAFRYLRRTCDATTPDNVLKAFANGMTKIAPYMEKLGKLSGVELTFFERPGNYPFDGYEDLSFVMFGTVPDFDAKQVYPHVRGLRGGVRHFKVIEDNVRARAIQTSFETSAKRLLQTADGRVCGVLAEKDGRQFAIGARQGVILACGGFEAAEDMKRQYFQGRDVLSAAFLGNTGDGIRMAQAVGAGLWHMWHYHGTYGLRHVDPDYPYGIRLARLPDWIPGDAHPDGMAMPWIVVDRDGRRFMNEYPPYVQDTGHRPMEHYDASRNIFPRIPATMIFDENGRKLYPVGLPNFNDTGVSLEWSPDNLAEVELGILHKADTIEELAKAIDVSAADLRDTVDRWNAACRSRNDAEFGRPMPSMVEVLTPPFYHAPVWPIVSNTQGGPVHDEHWRVLDAFGQPIPGLYEAGELGGIFGFLYLAGGNLAECYIGAWAAARHACASEPLRLGADSSHVSGVALSPMEISPGALK
jgi:succinate dehydrogenase/fumarate reductase flavoprotein subunit